MNQKKSPLQDIQSLNQNILNIDIEDLHVEALEDRIEMTLANLFGLEMWDGPGDPTQPCGQFSCTSYLPAI